MLENVRADARHYRESGGWWRSLGFWITATYRFGHWAHGLPAPAVRLPLLALHKIAATPWRFFKSVSIPARTRIGPGLCLHHPQNVIIPPDAVIGRDCALYQEVTLGRGPVPGVPRLGDRVTVWAGAKVLGGIRVGDGVEIGANAVLVRDVEAGSIVSAPPARVIPGETAARTRDSRAGVEA
jgi:serine O-acetyltransferase